MIKYTLQWAVLLGMVMLNTLESKAQNSNYMHRIAKIKVDSSQLENYKLALQEQMNTAIQLEPGVLSYTVVADKKDPSAITIFEAYANQEAYQSHIATPHFKKYTETVKNMVTSLELIDTDLLARVHQKEY